jgi:hypothetical protein
MPKDENKFQSLLNYVIKKIRYLVITYTYILKLATYVDTKIQEMKSSICYVSSLSGTEKNFKKFL